MTSDPQTSSAAVASPGAGIRLEAPSAIRIVEVDLSCLDIIQEINTVVFDEQRIINTFDREDLMLLLAYVEREPAGFKIGYRENRFTYYSAKGCVLPEYRRHGIARMMLYEMMERALAKGYVRMAFDTFPNKHPGMTVMGLREGFRVVKADYNAVYRDYRLRFEKKL